MNPVRDQKLNNNTEVKFINNDNKIDFKEKFLRSLSLTG